MSSSLPIGVSALAGAVYGSGATGDFLDGYSDLDLLVLTNAAVDSDDAMRLHDVVRHLDLSGSAAADRLPDGE